jgi:hypothetical protein
MGLYTGCRRNQPYFGTAFLTVTYTDATARTCIRSFNGYGDNDPRKCGLLAVPRTVPA